MIVGVHGIWQQQSGRNLLLRDWGPALRDGLERAGGHRSLAVELDIAFYGHLFLPPAGTKSTMMSDVDGVELLEDVTEEELADLTATVEEAGVDLVDGELKNVAALPPPLQRLVASIDRHFKVPVGVLMLGELRQVRRYLCDPDLKAAVDDIVGEAVTSPTRVLVGHSLGSVVALEYVRQHPQQRIALLVTLGSPLGLRMIRRYLLDPQFYTDRSLEGVQRWVNVYDPRDPVACAGGLAGIWPQVHDERVNNQLAAHSAVGYLAKQVTGAAILDVLREEPA